MGYKKVRIIRLTDQLSLVNNDDLGVNTASDAATGGSGGSSTIDDWSSIGDVPGHPDDGFKYGLDWDGANWVWRKLKDQDHYVSFDARFRLSTTSLEKGREISDINLLISSCNSTDFPLTGYTALTLNAISISADAITGSIPSVGVSPVSGIDEPAVFAITIEASADSVNKNASISFSWRKYWGVNSAVNVSHAEIEALTSQNIASGKNGTYTFNASGGKYLWIVYVQTLGTSTFTVGGLETTFLQSSITITNTYGTSTNYYIYRSQEVQFGTAISVVVT